MKTPDTYRARIQRVVDYLSAHLDDALTLETIAQVAHLSPYHFHRIYRGLLGETVSDTVHRLRLHRAAIDLLERNLTVERVATRAGYASQAAFTRAFRAEYGEPPARYRKSSRTDSTVYRVAMIVLPRLRVASLQHSGDYRLTTQAFERLMAAAATQGLFRSDTRSLGIFYDDPLSVPQEELRSMVCLTVPDEWIPSGGLSDAHLEGGRYARIVHRGPYTELRRAYDWLYQTWLPGSGEETRDLPCLEEYLNSPRQVAAKDLETALMMPLEE